MAKKKDKKQIADDEDVKIVDQEDIQESSAEAQNEQEPGETAEEPATPEAVIEKLQAQVAQEKKEYMFLMADFDNYRKRTLKEKQDLVKNASERVLADLLPIIDDFERAIEAMAKGTDVDSLREGVNLIYNKFEKYLERNNVKAIESTGQEFNDEFHEAVTTFAAPSDDMRGKVIDTVMKGYMINDKVLRHAKVVVGQ